MFSEVLSGGRLLLEGIAADGAGVGEADVAVYVQLATVHGADGCLAFRAGVRGARVFVHDLVKLEFPL